MMISKHLHRCRGKLSGQVMFLIGAVIVIAAVIVGYLAYRTPEKKKREVIGTVGYQSPFKLARHAGINLPIADQARPGSASPDTTVEVPIEWGKDLQAAEAKLTQRYDDIAAKLSKPENVQTFDETVTIHIDRDLEYRNLVQAVLAGQKVGFLKFRIACQIKGDRPETGHLTIELPTDVPVGKNVLLFRMYREGEIIRYIFGVSKIREYTRLKDAAAVMKNTVDGLRRQDPEALNRKILVMSPSVSISVQNAVEGLNAATYAGFKRIAFGRPPKLY